MSICCDVGLREHAVILTAVSLPSDSAFALRFHSPWQAWITLLISLAAGFLVVRMYLAEAGAASRSFRILLAVLRICLISIVLFMLYGATLQFFKTEHPNLILFIDNSRSMSSLEESAGDVAPISRLETCKKILSSGLMDALDERYRLNIHVLDGQMPNASDLPGTMEALAELRSTAASSPLGNQLMEMLQAATDQNATAIVMFTDGINTDGRSLTDVCQTNTDMPVFFVAPGDAKRPQDILIEKLDYDPVIFSGDLAVFRFQLKASGFPGVQLTAKLRRLDTQEVVASRTLEIIGDRFEAPVQLADSPLQPGAIQYQIIIDPRDGESNLDNNVLLAEIEVHDDDLKVLLVQNAPSYEFRFLRAVLSRRTFHSGTDSWVPIHLHTVLQQADLEVSEADKTTQSFMPTEKADLLEFDVIIFGDVDPTRMSHDTMQEIVNFAKVAGKGIIFIAGPNFTPSGFLDSPLSELFPFHSVSNDSSPNTRHPGFRIEPTYLGDEFKPMQLAPTQKQNREIWSSISIPWHLRVPGIRPGVRELASLVERNSNSKNSRPAITLHYAGRGKIVFHFFDSIYQLRFRGQEERLANYWLRSIRFLCQQKLQDKDDIQLKYSPDPPEAGRPIWLSLDFPDDRLAPAFASDLDCRVMSSDRLMISVPFVRTTSRGRFSARLSGLPPGDYKIQAKNSTQTLVETEFQIRPIDLELSNLVPNTGEMKKVSQMTDGQHFHFPSADKLLDSLPAGQLSQVGHPSQKPVWNSPYIALLFIILLTLEWTLRRVGGMF